MNVMRLLRLLSALVAPTLFCAVLASAQPGSGPAGSDQDPRVELDRFFRSTLETYQFVGLGGCLIDDGQIVWDGYYGYADRERQAALHRNNIFQLASLSKTVTVFALMMLYDEHRFQLDDDVNGYLPFHVRNPHVPEIPITFRMLLTHTSGLADVMPTGLKIPSNVPRPPSSLGDSDIPLEEYVEGILAPGGKYYSTEYFAPDTPGTVYHYSNIGYALVGYLVEKIAHQDFAEFCAERIFSPLGMSSTAWHLRDLDTARVVFGYSFSPNDTVPVYRKTKHFGEPGYPSGMLRTSMPDFVRFLSVLLNRGRLHDMQILRPETIDLLLRPQGIRNISSRMFPVVDMALGWQILRIDGTEFYSMNGFSGSIFTNVHFSIPDRSAMVYYYTGINMKNMAAMPAITRALHRALQRMNVSPSGE